MRPDRLATLTETIARALEAADLAAMLPAPFAAVVKVARLAGVDPIETGRAMAATWVRSLPSSAAADPARAASVAAWLAHVLAWVRGETDDPPPDLVL